jgi:DNA-binding CsgD family transcriptional regulator
METTHHTPHHHAVAEKYLSAISSMHLLETLRNCLTSFSMMLLTPEGTVLYANKTAVSNFKGLDTESVIGTNLQDFTPREWADERISMLQRAVDDGRPLIVLEIISGFRLCTHIKPIRADIDGKSQHMLLVIVELIIPVNFYWLLDHAEENNVVCANCIDLGCLNVLSDRELEVLALMGQGYRQKDIAEHLNRSISTINRHRESIGEKLQLTDRAQLVRLANIAILQTSDAKRNRITIGEQLTAKIQVGLHDNPQRVKTEEPRPAAH